MKEGRSGERQSFIREHRGEDLGKVLKKGNIQLLVKKGEEGRRVSHTRGKGGKRKFLIKTAERWLSGALGGRFNSPVMPTRRGGKSKSSLIGWKGGRQA